MPKITMNYDGHNHELSLDSHHPGRKEIEAMVLDIWGLNFGQYNLTYCDMDGDIITAEIQEDFEVANCTMNEEEGNDNLLYTLNLKDGAKP